MDRLIGYCGIKCCECPVYVATINDDSEEKQKIAESWTTEEYPLELKDVECHGCTSNGKIISFCKDCDIRGCGVEKQVDNCGLCKEYSCDKLNKVFEKSPEAKIVLDEVKKNNI